MAKSTLGNEDLAPEIGNGVLDNLKRRNSKDAQHLRPLSELTQTFSKRMKEYQAYAYWLSDRP